jgi:hypothetical protein
MKKEKLIIGRKDKADFPEWNLFDIDIKIDTGAYTSSIHCHEIQTEIIDGVKMVKFRLLDPSHDYYNHKLLSAPVFKEKKVKSSIGEAEKRYIIKSVIVLFGKKYKVDLSLTDRGSMRYPVLIGRKLLNQKFLVDTAEKNLSFNQKNAL